MTVLQRDREGFLRPVQRVSIPRTLFNEACDLAGVKVLGSTLEAIIIQYVNRRREKRGEDLFEIDQGATGGGL